MPNEADDELLREFKRLAHPTEASTERMWSALQTRLQGPDPVLGDPDPLHVAPGLRGRSRWLVPVVAATALAAGTLLMLRLGARLVGQAADSGTYDQAADQLERRPPSQAVDGEVRPAPPQPADVRAPVEPEPIRQPVPPDVAPPAAASNPVAHPPKPLPDRPAGLQAELVLVKPAREALQRGDADEALRLLSRHQSQFPDGVMALERRALEIQALCSLGKPEKAQRRANALLRVQPSSARAAALAAKPCRGTK